jgi:hypothetical protein
MANDGEATEKVGQRDKLDRSYINRDGEPTKKITPNVAKVVIRIKATGESVTISLGDLAPGKTLPEPSMLLCAAAFGINTVIGNQVAGATDPAEMIGRMTERADAIVEGEWSSGREGPRISHTLDAWKASLARRNIAVTDDDLAAMKEEITSGSATTTALLANDDIRAEYDAAAAQRMMEKAKASAAKAAGSKSSEIDSRFLPKSAQ